MRQKQKLSLEEKVKIAKGCLAGEVSINEAAAEVRVNWETIRRGVVQYAAEGAAAMRKKRYDRDGVSRVEVLKIGSCR